jgi:hypothetical protein
MKNRLILGLSLSLVGWLSICLFAESAEPKEIIRDKSPDGKFALRFTRDDKGFWEAAIINLKSKGEEMGLEIYQNGYIEGAHLVWSKDSQRVAYFEPDRRGGSTTVYFRKGSEFEERSIPHGDPYGDFPACEAHPAGYVKDVESTSRPVKWLHSGELVLAVHFVWLMESGATQATQGCGQTLTIAFDSDDKASVKSAVKSD